MMRALDKKVFEMIEIFSIRFIGFLLALCYVFPRKEGFVGRVEFFKKTLTKLSHNVIDPASKL